MAKTKTWGKAGVDAIKKYYDGIGKGDRAFFIRSDVPLYSMSVGDHVLRIMPPKNAGEFFGLEIAVHSGIGINKDSFLCTEKTKIIAGAEIPCPICTRAAKLAAHGAADDEVWPLKPRRRVLFNIVDLDKPRDGVKIWVAPITAADDIVRLCYDKRTKKMVDITDPEEGYDIFISREGEGLQTRYKGIQTDKQASAIDTVYLDQLLDFEDILILPDEKILKRALAEDEDESESSSESVDEPAPWEMGGKNDTPGIPDPAISESPSPRRRPAPITEEEPQKTLAERVKEAAKARYRGE